MFAYLVHFSVSENNAIMTITFKFDTTMGLFRVVDAGKVACYRFLDTAHTCRT